MRRPKKQATKQDQSDILEVIEDIALDVKAQADYYDYAVEVIEDRAIYAKTDGLKPVTRRLLWDTYKLGARSNAKVVKAAKVVGDTMGNYHPHGDAAIFGALVTAANAPTPMFDRSGNWGSMTSDAAAPRYIECRLSEYSDAIFFDKFYINAIPYVPNYDESSEEPLILPTLLPNALINGNFGIAPGVRTMTPTFTMASVCKVLIAALKNGGTATPKICMDLEFTTEYGGVLRKTTPKADLLAFFQTGKGRFVFDSTLNDDGTRLRIDRFGPIGSLDGTQGKKGYNPGLLDKITALPGVDRIYNDTNTNDKFNAYAVEFKRGMVGAGRELTVSKIANLLSGAVSYNVQVVDRKVHVDFPYGYKKLQMSTIPAMINDWIVDRIALEKAACNFWLLRRKKQILHLNLMRLAVKNRSFIIKALDKPLNDEGLANYIATGLKITVEQANIILDLKVRQLKALEDKKLVEQIRLLKEEVESYNDRIARPKSYIAKQIVQFSKDFALK
jgi:DNA gyrase/topoisomerase IV subunit A